MSRAGARRRALLAADLVALVVAFSLVQLFVSRFEPADYAISLLLVPGLLGWVVLAHVYGLYDEIGANRSVADDFPGIVLLSTLGTWVGLVLVEFGGFAEPQLRVSAAFWLLSIALITAARISARAYVQRAAVADACLVVGTGRVAQRIVDKLRTQPELGLEPIGFVDDEPLAVPEEGPRYLGNTARLEHIVRAYGVRRVIVAFTTLSGDAQLDLLRRCADLRVRVDIVPRMYEVIGSKTYVHDIAGIPLVSVKPPGLSRMSRVLKRSLDVALGSLVLIIFAPLMAYCAIRIKLESAGPVFFRQERMGAGGKRFEILKFRSMYIDADARKSEVGHLNMHSEDGPKMFKVPQDPRITSFGRFLRRWSLDELPQLFNVLRGEMSLVGPRPLILDEDENIRGHNRRRIEVTPGVTGLWQVLGRSNLPFAEMIALDYLYVTNWSLWGDIKLLARTVPVVINRRGAY
jgi:exopolysaccharide biosynthesis polyprenyl glycosylphosphotransferase